MSNARFPAGMVQRALDAAKSLGTIVSVELVRGLPSPVYEVGARSPGFVELGVPCLQLIQALLGKIVALDATWSSPGVDRDLPFDDWRARVQCANGVGHFELTSRAEPAASNLVIHGTQGELRVDRARLRDRLARERELPALDAEAVRLLEDIATAAEADRTRQHARFPRSERVPFLVTGASGKVGKAMVARLVADGHRVRVMVRRIPETPVDQVEYCFGDLGDPAAVDRAVEGAATVIHLGATTRGGWPEHRIGTVAGTQHVVDACGKHGVAQLVHVSSMSVLDWVGSADQGPVTEHAALEPRPEERGAYTRAKLLAERTVAAAAAGGLPCVILRPGQIFGGGIPLINGAVARDAGGRWLILGDGKLELPLVYLDDLIDAIVATVTKRLTHGEVIQIIDPAHLTQREVLALSGSTRGIVAVPRPIVFALGKLSELPLKVIGRTSPIAAYRLRSALARLHFESDRARQLLGWSPNVGVREGIRRVSA